uniref:Uncharacterized protein n=1 Tax=Setaria viridis TaxID=4556 RepID=A0A4U6W1U4_SETVI|nr:hypothetical protein SEVIR_2G430500v2 [Setaria viridis]
MLNDDIFCGGFNTDEYVIDVFLYVGVGFLHVLLCAVGAHFINNDAGLVNRNMAAGGCFDGDGESSINILSLQGRSVDARMPGLYFLLVRKLASDPGDEEETIICR